MYDIVGEDQYIGEDQDISGDVGFLPALRGFPGLIGPRAQPRPAQPAQPVGPTLVPRSVQGILRRQILPIPATTVGAGASVTVTLQPQRAFRVERLVLASSVSPSQVVVSDISVGAERQFVSAGDVPLSAFSADAVGTGLRGDTAQPGTTVTVTLRNLGGSAETISGAFFGSSAE